MSVTLGPHLRGDERTCARFRASENVRRLRGKSGKDLDQAYDQMQRKGHEDAVALFEAYPRAAIMPT